MAINKWKKLSSKIVYKNPWYQIREDSVITPSGKTGTYSVVMKKHSVFIIALDTQNKIYLVAQYRYTTSMVSLEVPGGGIEKDETPSDAAQRELMEETGLITKELIEIGIAQLENGVSDAIGHIFIAKKLSSANMDKRKEEGIEKPKLIPYIKVLALIKDGTITDSISITAITKALLYLELI